MSRNKMLKRINKKRIRYRVVVYEEINAFFLEKDPKMTKIPKIFQLSESFSFFCQFFDRLRGLECFKGSTRKKLVVQLSFIKKFAMF